MCSKAHFFYSFCYPSCGQISHFHSFCYTSPKNKAKKTPKRNWIHHSNPFSPKVWNKVRVSSFCLYTFFRKLSGLSSPSLVILFFFFTQFLLLFFFLLNFFYSFFTRSLVGFYSLLFGFLFGFYSVLFTRSLVGFLLKIY